ncbi:hypothetical protein KXQ82_16415 [Mucilaginibacter sp. HMF5004]|uniref:hypothetical protein n=1 Tax=Mucilaginibacter rivuli TaxID=2857527 RepID=UPI001C5EE50F|nr:hypothetical protein [Mucilaginibacter rivuli]MBW4891313.1 hypothetical protein [Mucilaginibacter rivuli]
MEFNLKDINLNRAEELAIITASLILPAPLSLFIIDSKLFWQADIFKILLISVSTLGTFYLINYGISTIFFWLSPDSKEDDNLNFTLVLPMIIQNIIVLTSITNLALRKLFGTYSKEELVRGSCETVFLVFIILYVFLFVLAIRKYRKKQKRLR